MVHKILNGLAPSVLRDFIHLRCETSVRSTRLSLMSDCLVPFRRSAFGLSSFGSKATKQWNALPEDIKGCKAHVSSKLKLKSF